MKKFILQKILSAIDKKGLSVQRMLPAEKVLGLIELLYPVRTQFELIRLGPDKDGGYLVPDCLDGIAACFSPGVAQVSEFELDCLKRGMKIFLADKTVDKPNWTVPKDQYDFQKKFIGCTNNADFMTLDSWVQYANLPHDAELLLQMDVEGDEYATIINSSDELMSRFKILVIEFHRLQHLWNEAFFGLAETVFKKILQTHYCVHIHPNNYKNPEASVFSRLGVDIPMVMEFSFVRKDVARIMGFQTQFPHPLDFDNSSLNKTSPLPGNWYK
ncbi:MAG: hypothetical protein AAFZ15_25520 [Bacteroidota bacterium]